MHPAIKAAIEALKNNSEAFAQIPDDAFGYIEDGTGDENGPHRWPIAREMEGHTKKALTALRALEGCVVIERDKLEGMRNDCLPNARCSRTTWNDCIDKIIAAQMKGE